MYYDIGDLYLEITRACTLACKHCLRGDRTAEAMSEDTINSVFNRVIHIHQLLLAGGEPLLAVTRIKWVIEAIKRNKTAIDDIVIVTNGTALNEKIMETLRELSTIAEVRINISDDIFHQLELDRLGLRKIRDINKSILQREFGATMYNFGKRTRDAIYPIGRAKDLTQEQLDEINSKSPVEYYIENDWQYPFDKTPVYRNGYIIGELPIDVNGNVTGYNLSYEQEDALARDAFNVEKQGLEKAVINCISYFKELSEKEENKDHSQK